jgi:hypothetical protein
MIDERKGVRVKLKRACEVVPVACYQGWSVQRVREFKLAVSDGRAALARPNSSLGTLQARLSRLESFWAPIKEVEHVHAE